MHHYNDAFADVPTGLAWPSGPGRAQRHIGAHESDCPHTQKPGKVSDFSDFNLWMTTGNPVHVQMARETWHMRRCAVGLSLDFIPAAHLCSRRGQERNPYL